MRTEEIYSLTDILETLNLSAEELLNIGDFPRPKRFGDGKYMGWHFWQIDEWVKGLPT